MAKVLGGIKIDPPEKDEFEISLFGPGFGESIVIHIGNNNWVIIDSCIHPSLHDPIPLDYLKKINVNPVESVKLIVATHWHDDHIKGISDIVEECKKADFCCSDALKSDEFRTFISAFGDSGIDDSGVSELYQILHTLIERKKTPKLALANRIIISESEITSGLNVPVFLYTLSPSDASRILSIKTIGTLLEEEFKIKNKRRIVDPSENHISIALWITIGSYHFLLGSDLENRSDSQVGWKAIIEDKNKPVGKALYIKIPHHGSYTAHNDKIWTDLLVENPIACLTPFQLGRHRIPEEKDVHRIYSKTNLVYATSKFFKPKKIHRESAVDRTIREMGVKLETIYSSMGQIRLRFKPSSKCNPAVELINGAIELKDILSI
ncbi:MAG: MBL fold metallo-hydrolase [Spirochaetales bacterium]|nr:MBL fold metallo-hydrolase [Spirochaetales bacterium]